MARELPIFKAFLILALLGATLALTLLGPAHSGQMDVFANPVIAQAEADAKAAASRGEAPRSPMIEGDHPGSLSTSSVEGSGTAKPDTTGDARRNTPGSAKRDTSGDAKR